MDLTEKFRRFQEQRRQSPDGSRQEAARQGPPGPPLGGCGSASAEKPAPPPAPPAELDVCRPLGLELQFTPRGWVGWREVSYPPGHRHGSLSLGSFVRLPPEALALLALPPVPLPASSWAFLDTETTGLAGGAGTMVFLGGIAFYRDDTLVVRQYLCPGPAAEPALVGCLLADLQHFPGLMTFNGKVFDWPLLRDRAILHRQGFTSEPVHADLLFPSRWLFRPLVNSCRLSCLETEILGSSRLSDVPAELIPALYAEYLRTGNPDLLQPVLAHNLADLLSLAALACRLLQPWLDPGHARPEELYGLARLLAARGMTEKAIPLWESALSSLPPSLAARAGYQLGLLYRRRGEFQRAARVWQRVTEMPTPQEALAPVEPLLELAKYHEHVSKDLPEAHRLTLQAIHRLRQRQPLEAGGQGNATQVLQELKRRLQRIENKLQRPRRQA